MYTGRDVEVIVRGAVRAAYDEAAKIAEECRVLLLSDETSSPVEVAQEAGRDIARQIRLLKDQRYAARGPASEEK